MFSQRKGRASLIERSLFANHMLFSRVLAQKLKKSLVNTNTILFLVINKYEIDIFFVDS